MQLNLVNIKHSIVLAALLFSVCTYSSAGALDSIRKSGEITIAHRDASVPFSYIQTGGEPLGYGVDICKRVVAALARELSLSSVLIKWVPVTSGSRIQTIAEGKADLECGSTTNTFERRQKVDYTIAYFIAASRFLVRTESGIQNLAGLEGKTVVSTTGTTKETLQNPCTSANHLPV